MALTLFCLVPWFIGHYFICDQFYLWKLDNETNLQLN